MIAYLWILTDRLPGASEPPARFEVAPSGTPTAGSALLRILTAIPSAFILALLMFVSSIIWVIAAIWILIAETYPESLFGFQRGVVRWTARLLAYLASLVDSVSAVQPGQRPERLKRCGGSALRGVHAAEQPGKTRCAGC